MPPRRMKMKTGTKRKAYSKRKPATRNIVKKIVQKELNKNIETKRSCFTAVDGTEIGHNNFITVDTSLLHTTKGVTDPTSSQTANRIGDEINFKGMSIKMMLELNERYSDVTYRIMIVKSARGDIPSNTTLWNNLSANRMLDTINTERYTIVYQKYGKIKAPNYGANAALGGATYVGSGLYNEPVMSRATKIVKFNVSPKMLKVGVIKYDGSSVDASQPKFFDYRLVIYAYSNYSTSDALGWNVLRLNDYIREMFYKDA